MRRKADTLFYRVAMFMSVIILMSGADQRWISADPAGDC